MNSMVETVEAKVTLYVRDAMREIKLDELVDAFPDIPVGQIRLTAQDLRKRGLFSGRAEEGVMYYSWIPRASPGTPALRHPNSQIGKPAAASTVTKVFPVPATNPTPMPMAQSIAADKLATPAKAPVAERVTSAEKIWRAMEGGRIFRIKELAQACECSSKTVEKTLGAWIGEGKVFARGQTAARRYSTKPFFEAVEPLRAPSAATDSSPPIEPAEPRPHVMERVPRDENAPDHTIKDDAASSPRFAWWSDGTLQIDCDNCSGHLTREDLRAMSDFVNGIPALAHG